MNHCKSSLELLFIEITKKNETQNKIGFVFEKKNSRIILIV